MSHGEDTAPDAVLIREDGTTHPIHRAGRETLAMLYAAIGCTEVEWGRLRPPAVAAPSDAWWDGEFLSKTDRLNPRASHLLGRPLHGPVMVTGGEDANGNTLPIDPVVASDLLDTTGPHDIEMTLCALEPGTESTPCRCGAPSTLGVNHSAAGRPDLLIVACGSCIEGVALECAAKVAALFRAPATRRELPPPPWQVARADQHLAAARARSRNHHGPVIVPVPVAPLGKRCEDCGAPATHSVYVLIDGETVARPVNACEPCHMECCTVISKGLIDAGVITGPITVTSTEGGTQ